MFSHCTCRYIYADKLSEYIFCKWRKISWNCRQSLPFIQRGAHDTPAAVGLGRSAECDSVPHCSSLLTACLSANSPCSLSEEDRAKRLPKLKSFHVHFPPETPKEPPRCCQNTTALCGSSTGSNKACAAVSYSEQIKMTDGN